MNKRSSKAQRDLLVEELHANMDKARGNTADKDVKIFWAELAAKLNTKGCQRTVQEWQHVWDVLRAKAKTKARKLKRHVAGTGGGPAMPGLSDLEDKIMAIVGPAAVNGFADLEFGLQTPCEIVVDDRELEQDEPQLEGSSSGNTLHNTIQNRALGPGNTPPQRLPRTKSKRRRVVQQRTPRGSTVMVDAITENGRLMREALDEASNTIAAALSQSNQALIQAAIIIANAYSGNVGRPAEHDYV